MSKTAYMRGLQNFISDIRSAPNKEQEQRRVQKELAKIRERFLDDKSLSGYDRRKYVWKLLYIYMLGYEIEFGHKQAADLIPQPKYKDKQVGYMACSLLLRENDEFLRLTMNAIRMDLTSRNEAFETLALSFICNVGGTDMAEALTQDVIKLLSSGAARPLVKKRAALALLKLIRKTPQDQQVVTPDVFSPVINALLDERDLGLLLSVTTLLQGICARNGPAGYEGSQPRLIRLLERLTMQREKEVGAEYLYYGIPSPWLQCKCLRVLQFFPAPEVPADRASLTNILQGIIKSVGGGDAAKNANANKANALHAILFEAISLALQLETDTALLTTCVSVLGSFLSAKEPNVKYLALETLSRLALVPDILEAIRHHQSTVVASLKDTDVSIRKRAMDLLFTMCDATCAEQLVKEMLSYLVTADFTMREELVLKVAILAEKFAPSVQWYVDVVLELLEKAGDFVSEDVWHRVVQLVTNNPAMQQYAARNVVEVLKRGATHESLVCTAAYILGEFGRLIVNEVPPAEQFKLLHNVFPPANQPTKGLLMTAFVKIYLLQPNDASLRNSVMGLFERFQRYMDAELQQRALEYMRIAASPQAAAQHYLLPMPKWEERESSLLKRLQATEGHDTDASSGAPAMRGVLGKAAGSAGPGTPSSTSAVSMVGAPIPAAPGSTRLMVGAPLQEPQPSVDLWGPEAQPSGAPLMAQNGSAAATSAVVSPPQQQVKANPVDLLSDLLTGAVIVNQPPAAAPAPPGMAPMPGATLQHTDATAMPVQYTGTAPPHYQGMPMGGAPPHPPYPPYAQAPVYPPQHIGYPAQHTGPGVYPTQTTGQSAGSQPLSPYPAAPGYPQQPGYPPAPHATPFGAPPQGQYHAQQTLQPPVPGYPTGLQPTMSFGASLPVYGTQPGLPASVTGTAPAAAGVTGGPAAAGVPGSPGAARPTGSIEGWFRNLLIKDRGILYEDQNLQIGVQSRFLGSTGQVVLFLGNKNADAALQAVHLLVNPPPGLQVSVGPAPAVLQPKQQVQVTVSVTALAPFAGAPSLVLGYQLPPQGVTVRQDLHLPVAPHKFITPEPGIPKDLFFSEWKTHSAPPSKAQEMVDRGSPLATPALVTLTRMANLGVQHGYLDPSPHNEAGAGYFVCGAPGSEQRVLVMARMEGNPQTMSQFRVTVASPAPQLSAQVKELLVSNLRTIAA